MFLKTETLLDGVTVAQLYFTDRLFSFFNVFFIYF